MNGKNKPMGDILSCDQTLLIHQAVTEQTSHLFSNKSLPVFWFRRWASATLVFKASPRQLPATVFISYQIAIISQMPF